MNYSDPNFAFKVAARYRDGDHCRFCGTEVYWRGQTKPHKGVTLEEQGGFVVACFLCSQTPHRMPLQPAPPQPYYYDLETKHLLTKHGLIPQVSSTNNLAGKDNLARLRTALDVAEQFTHLLMRSDGGGSEREHLGSALLARLASARSLAIKVGGGLNCDSNVGADPEPNISVISIELDQVANLGAGVVSKA
jgi:hypothetical protein